MATAPPVGVNRLGLLGPVLAARLIRAAIIEVIRPSTSKPGART